MQKAVKKESKVFRKNEGVKLIKYVWRSNARKKLRFKFRGELDAGRAFHTKGALFENLPSYQPSVRA